MSQSFKRKRRDQVSLNLVPVMDMLTAIIFFLLVSTTFIEFAKIPVPPSGVKTITDPVAPPPLAPKLFLDFVSQREYGVLLSWSGVKPGEKYKKVKIEEFSELSPYPLELKALVDEILKDFIAQYPLEKTIQIGFGEQVPYRSVIAVMDGAFPVLPDVVLVSYESAKLMVQAVSRSN